MTDGRRQRQYPKAKTGLWSKLMAKIWCPTFNRYVLFTLWQSDHSFYCNIFTWIFDLKFKVKTVGHIWGLALNHHVCFFVLCESAREKIDGQIWWPTYIDVFHSMAMRPFFSWDIHVGISLLFFCVFCLFVSRQSDHFSWDTANQIFSFENSMSRSWPK